ncbi:MAG: type II secretion system protein [Lachnospiraceae bacterium]|nr:type II secretion system protein [Lachnospiraceae bacterium]
MKKMNNKGFSLVELIVVIAIMAVLIGVLAPQFMKYVEKSRESTDIQNLDTCISAVRTYYADKDTDVTSVTISGTKGNPLSGDNAALSDAGCANSIVKGDWGTGGISATINMSTGAVTYSGTAKHYKAKADSSGFEAVTSTPSPSPSPTNPPAQGN